MMTEIAEMTAQYANDFRPMRPSLRTSPNPATPTTSDENTSGITVISNTRRKSWPTGSVMLGENPDHHRMITAKGTIDPHARHDANGQPDEDARVQRKFATRDMGRCTE